MDSFDDVLGGDRKIKIDIRVIAATNKDLSEATKDGTFRSDLFYRLNVVPIRIPLLRERKEDIIPLALHFIQDFNHELKRSYKGISQEAAQAIENYPWPGNVRELKNIIERIMSLHVADEIQFSHLPLEIRDFRKLPEERIMDEVTAENSFLTLKQLEEKYIERVLEHTHFNKAQAARILGIHPTSLFRKLKHKD